jgi:glucose/arabinose dehydrogenase
MAVCRAVHAARDAVGRGDGLRRRAVGYRTRALTGSGRDAGAAGMAAGRWLAIGVLMAVQLVAAPGRAQLPLARLSTPPGFAVEVFAEVPGARSLVVAEGGAKVYVGTRGDKVFVIRDPERDGIANEVAELASGLKVPNGLALGPDGALFVVEQHQISRLDPASGEREVVVPPGVLPDFRHHGWRYADFSPDGLLYVTIGAPCNICEVRGFEGTIVRLRPDGHELEVFARGVRNSLGLDWHPVTHELFFTDNGGDELGDLIPPDELNRAPERDLHFGYPYRYGPATPYPQFRAVEPPGPVTPPALAFEAHVAALGLHFYRGRMFPADYRHDAFVAQHGSWNRSDPIGYRVMRVRFDADGNPTGKEVFIDGWLGASGRAWGRPVDVAELPDGSLLISDDEAGVIYRVSYRRG